MAKGSVGAFPPGPGGAPRPARRGQASPGPGRPRAPPAPPGGRSGSWSPSGANTGPGRPAAGPGGRPSPGITPIRARWEGRLEPDGDDFLLVHLKTEVLEWRLGEKAGPPGEETRLEAPPRARAGAAPQLCSEGRAVPRVQLRPGRAHRPAPPRSFPARSRSSCRGPRPGRTASPGDRYDDFLTAGSNRIVLPADGPRPAEAPNGPFPGNGSGRPGARVPPRPRRRGRLQRRALGRGRRRPRRPLIPGPSGPRVELVVDAAEPLPADVGVDLRRRDLAVAEHELDRAQVRPPLEQVRRERMPQDVRADLGAQPGLRGVLAEELPQSLAREGAAPPRQEQLLPLLSRRRAAGPRRDSA